MDSQPNTTTYRVDDKEILLNVYKRLLWDRMLPVIPRRITPNAITIFGQLCIIGAAIFAFAATSGQTGLFMVSAFLVLTYLTADNLDGPHARRTGQTSALGELLDHGLDGIASGCMLLMAAFTLKITGVYMVALCVIGAFGFIVPFWEQYRTGVLTIPAMSGTEAVTLLVLLQSVVALFSQPQWAAFSPASFNLASVVLVITMSGYAVAAGIPMLQGLRARRNPAELFPAIIIAASFFVFVLTGASAIVPSIAVSLFAADVVCRMILMRHQAMRREQIVSPAHALILAPLAVHLAAPNLWYANGWAMLTLAITVLLYSKSLVSGAIQLLAQTRD